MTKYTAGRSCVQRLSLSRNHAVADTWKLFMWQLYKKVKAFVSDEVKEGARTSAWPGSLCSRPGVAPQRRTDASRRLWLGDSATPSGRPEPPCRAGTAMTSTPSAAPRRPSSTAWAADAPCDLASASANTMPPPPGREGHSPPPPPPPPPRLWAGTNATISVRRWWW